MATILLNFVTSIIIVFFLLNLTCETVCFEKEAGCLDYSHISMGRILALESNFVQMQRTLEKYEVEIELNTDRIIQLEKQNLDLNTTVQELEMEIVQLRRQSIDLNETVEFLQYDFAEAEIRINSTSEQVAESKHELANIQIQTEELNETFLHLQSRINLVEGLDAKTNSSIFDLETAVSNMEKKQKNLSASLQDQCSRDAIAFKARRKDYGNFSGDDIFVFDIVLRNYNNSYNSSTGIFVAPIEGNYLFSVTILAQSGKTATMIILKNEIEVGRFYSGKGGAQSSSETVILDLEKGNRVYVKAMTGETAYIQGNRYSSFTGVLLQTY